MTKFYNISKEEMEEFLGEQGFKSMKLPNTLELVYGKLVYKGEHKVSLRVYTAINPSGESRGVGSDAIRVIPYIMYEQTPFPICKSQTVRRIETWKKNLQKAIDCWEQEWRICPACGYPMVERDGRNGKFWGCSTWSKTKCNGKPKTEAKPQVEEKPKTLYETLMNPKSESPKEPEKPVIAKVDQSRLTGVARFRIPEDRISADQKRSEVVFNETDDHLILPSRAGGGKTTMLKHLASFRKPDHRMIYLAFNSKNANEGRKKLPREVPSMTTHSFGKKIITDYGIKLPKDPAGNKNYQIMEDVYPAISKNAQRKRIRKACFKLIGLSKNFAVRIGDTEAIRDITSQYTFNFENDLERNEAVEIVNEVLSLSLPDQRFGPIYDFDDMIWWPVVLDLKMPFYNVALLDEAQDFNACQIEMVKRMRDAGSRILIVGDPFQAVYRFRGADSKAFHKLSDLLKSDPNRKCQEVLLPTNYRCARKIIEWVVENSIVKDIQAAPNAIEGNVIEDMNYNQIIDMLVADFGQPV